MRKKQKYYGDNIKPTVKGLKNFLDCYPNNSRIVLDGNIDILTEKIDEYTFFGERVINTHDNHGHLWAVGEVFGNPEFDGEYNKANLGDLVETLSQYPPECKVDFNNISIKNTGGLLNNIVPRDKSGKEAEFVTIYNAVEHGYESKGTKKYVIKTCPYYKY